MFDFQEIAITVLEKQGVMPSEVRITNAGDFVCVYLYTVPKHLKERTLGLSVHLDSDLEGKGTWPTKAQVRWPEVPDATAHEASEIARLLNAAAELAAAFDAATGAEEVPLSYEETITQNLKRAGLKVARKPKE